MKAPVEEPKPSELFAAILKQPRPFDTYDFPRKKIGTDEAIGQVSIVVLTQAEVVQATSEAERKTREEMKRGGGIVPGKDEQSHGYAMIFQEALYVQLVYASCYVPGTSFRPEDRTFRMAPDVGKLTQDEIAVLANLYNITRAKCGPIISQMDDDEADGFAERLVEAANFGPLAGLSPAVLIGLVASLARKLLDLRIANSTSGASPDDMPSGETPSSPDLPSETGSESNASPE